MSVEEIYRFSNFLLIDLSFFIIQCPLKVMCGNKWWSTKVGAKLLSDLVILSIPSSDMPLDFYEWICVVTPKYLMYFLADKSTK